MEPIDARLAALELAVGELRTTVAELEQRLATERTRIRTMRHTVQCPSCGGRRILHVRTVHQVSAYGLVPLALASDIRWSGVKQGGPLQAYACRNCGLLEWHATGLDLLEPDGENVVELEAEAEPPPPTTPYR